MQGYFYKDAYPLGRGNRSASLEEASRGALDHSTLHPIASVQYDTLRVGARDQKERRDTAPTASDAPYPTRARCWLDGAGRNPPRTT